jgi:nucleoside-diphosphate-sugar epimerase
MGGRIMQGSMLIAGASGIAGSSLARELIGDGATVYGLARNP